MSTANNNSANELARGLLKSSQTSARYTLRDFSVLVKSDRREPLAWMRSFVSPFYQIGDLGEADWLIGYRADPRAFAEMAKALSGAPVKTLVSRARENMQNRHIEYDIPEMRALLNGEFNTFCLAWPAIKEVLLLAPEDSSETRRYLGRTLRKLTTLHHQRRGAVVMHACAFEIDGEITVGVADKNGGKTTFLLQNLLAGARFVSNDRVLLYRDNDRVGACGLPNIITLRPGTLDCLPALKERLDNLARIGRPLVKDSHGRLRITADQLCRLLDASTCTGAPVKKVVFLSPENLRDQVPDRDAALAYLRESFFDYGDRPRVFFSSLYPLDMDNFRAKVDALCDVLLDTTEYLRQGWMTIEKGLHHKQQAENIAANKDISPAAERSEK